MSLDTRGHALRALSQFLIAESEMGETLRQVTDIALAAMPDAHTAALSVRDGEGRVTCSFATDAVSEALEAAQREEGTGPSDDAGRRGRVVRIDDMEAQRDRYPGFAALASVHGVQSTLSLPMSTNNDETGVLNLYSRQSCGFTGADEGAGIEIAAAAAVVVANASAYWGAHARGQQLVQAMRGRALVEQAKGIIMSTRGMSAEEAFAVLEAHSQREHRGLAEVAEDVIDRQHLDAVARAALD